MTLNLNMTDIYEERLVEFIRQTVCSFYNVPVERLSKKTKKSDIVHCRHMIIYLSAKCIDVPLRRLADLCGYNGDHSMILYVKKKIDGYMSWDNKLRKDVTVLMNHIEASLYDQKKAKIESIDYINLNNIVALRENMNRAVLLVGYSQAEIEQLKLLIGNNNNSITFENTGVYLFNDKNSNNEKK